MPRVSLQQTNFTAGEISPRLIGRTDIDRYGNAAKRLINAMPVVHGGARRRWGTRWIGITKYGGGRRSRMIPFVYSRDVAYMLEFTHLAVRVWPAGGGALVAEIPATITEDMLEDILEIADDPQVEVQDKRVRIDTRKWIMGKLKPKKYGDTGQKDKDKADEIAAPEADALAAFFAETILAAKRNSK
jgi:hypothetical protein